MRADSQGSHRGGDHGDTGWAISGTVSRTHHSAEKVLGYTRA
jgi:hypothetical protein